MRLIGSLYNPYTFTTRLCPARCFSLKPLKLKLLLPSMWQRLLRPVLVRPAASVVALHALPAFNAYQQERRPAGAVCNCPCTQSRKRFVWCAPKLDFLPCTACGETCSRVSFSANQLRRSTRICKGCAALNTAANVAENQPASSFTCTNCCEELPPELPQNNSVDICQMSTELLCSNSGVIYSRVAT